MWPQLAHDVGTLLQSFFPVYVHLLFDSLRFGGSRLHIISQALYQAALAKAVFKVPVLSIAFDKFV